ncbi:MAG: diheme cytochrome c [Burkholderiaceae bacterium]|jgi:cytochrome c553|nr:diheme cytochrome c [Burkholderiaceae bacterium]
MSINTIVQGAVLAAAVALPLAARAGDDRLTIPANAPPSFKAECGGCHLAFPPALLTAPDWRRVMASLDKHYGDNASLDAKTREEIEIFLTRNAATRSKMAGQGDPPWLTRTPWFEREHREVPTSLWRDARVVSASNCAACHGKAEQGSFRKRELLLPELQRGKKHRHHDDD